MVYAVVSSAKREHVPSMDCGRSLMYKRNSTGPNTVPLGIPDHGDCHDYSNRLVEHTVGDSAGMMTTTREQSARIQVMTAH